MKVDDESRTAIKEISAKINQCLVHTGYSKRKFAAHCLLTEATVRNIINNSSNIEVNTLTKLRLAFKISLSDLFNEKVNCSTLNKLPVTVAMFQATSESDKKKIGKRIIKLMKYRKLGVEDLSILSGNMDYSKALKYLKGAENITLITIMKFAYGLEISFKAILDFNGPMPSYNFIGKDKSSS